MVWEYIADAVNSVGSVLLDIWDNYKWYILLGGIGLIAWLTMRVDI